MTSVCYIEFATMPYVKKLPNILYFGSLFDPSSIFPHVELLTKRFYYFIQLGSAFVHRYIHHSRLQVFTHLQ